MLWPEQIKKSFRSLFLHRLRSLLSTLGVLFGVVAVIAMLAIGEGAKQETLEQIEQLGMNNIMIREVDMSDDLRTKAREKKSRGLTLEDAKSLQEGVPFIRLTAPMKIIEGKVTGTWNEVSPEVLATSRSFGDIKSLKTIEGRFLSDADVNNRLLVAVLGYEVAKSLGKYGHIGESIRIENKEFLIVGILAPRHWSSGKNTSLTSRNLNQVIFIPIGAEKSLPQHPSKKNNLSEIILQIKQSNQMNRALQSVKRVLELSHHGVEDYQVVIPQELFQQASRTHQTFNLVLGSIAAISLLVGGIGIMNIMLANVSERTREIGIRRAVGANKRHIILQFLTETLILTLSGAILGVALGIGVSLLISYLAEWKTIVTAWSVLLSLGMATIVGLCSGLYPAFKAASMNPINALRHL